MILRRGAEMPRATAVGQRHCRGARPALLALLAIATATTGCSRGNYPEAGSCNEQLAYFAVCTHADHGLKSWTGVCRGTREEAQQDAQRHAREQHQEQMQWTGVLDYRKAQELMR